MTMRPVAYEVDKFVEAQNLARFELQAAEHPVACDNRGDHRLYVRQIFVEALGKVLPEMKVAPQRGELLNLGPGLHQIVE